MEERYEKLNELLSDPEIVNDPKKLREYSKEQSESGNSGSYREYKTARSEYKEAKEMLEEKLTRK